MNVQTTDNTHRIAVLIPCYNEETTIEKVIIDFRKQLPDANIYVFDNNSNDKTSEKASEAGAIVVREHRQGKGNVVRNMFRKIDADIFIMVDGDDTYPPTNVHEMIEPIIKGEADMVIGDRLSSTYFTENQRKFHGNGNKLVKWIINRMFKSNIHDILTGYRAFSREFVKNMPVQSKGFEIETELTAYALHFNYLIKEVVVPYQDRPEDSMSKLNTFKDGYKILNTAFSLYRDYKPYAFFSLLAVLISIIAIIFLTPVFLEYFHTGLVARFPTLIFGCFMLLGALLLYCSGLILQVLTNQNKKTIDSISLKND